MKKIHKDRLLKLAKFLKTVPTKYFDMNWFMKEDDNGHKHEKAALECGTSACALGWATAIFPQLYYDWEYREVGLKGLENAFYEPNTNETAENFFGLNADEVEKLFFQGLGNDWHRGRRPKEEAKIIENLVKSKEKV